MKKRKKHKSSILQQKGEPCYLCMKLKPMREWRRAVHEHHIFGGSNRNKSEAEGLKVYLCLEHHISGKEAVHNNAEMMRLLREAVSYTHLLLLTFPQPYDCFFSRRYKNSLSSVFFCQLAIFL